MIFDYLSGLFCIRSSGNTPFIATQFKLSKPLRNVHLDVLKYCYDNGYSTALIYENELSIIRDLEDINNNEIKNFMLSNTDWDIMLIGVNEIPYTSLVNGYTRVFKVNDASTFYSNYVYIASRRFMQKAKTNNLTSINTYLYRPTFITNIGNIPKASVYTVGTVTDIIEVDDSMLKYKWTPLKL
jgi:hypothetical protein